MVAFFSHLLAVGLTLPQIAPPVPHIVAARVLHLATARVPFSPVAVLADRSDHRGSNLFSKKRSCQRLRAASRSARSASS